MSPILPINQPLTLSSALGFQHNSCYHRMSWGGGVAMHSSELELSLSWRNLTFLSKVALENICLLPSAKCSPRHLPSHPCVLKCHSYSASKTRISVLAQANEGLCIDINGFWIWPKIICDPPAPQSHNLFLSQIILYPCMLPWHQCNCWL